MFGECSLSDCLFFHYTLIIFPTETIMHIEKSINHVEAYYLSQGLIDLIVAVINVIKAVTSSM